MIDVPVTPVAKPRMTQRDKWKKRPVVMAYRAFCDSLREHVGTYELPERFHVTFHVPIPRSWSMAKKERTVGSPHRQRPDVDNFLKALADALCAEDSHLWDVRATKVWSRDGRIVIEEMSDSSRLTEEE